MKLNRIKISLLIICFLLASQAANASVVWNCDGANLETLQITNNSGTLKAVIGWDYYGPGDAIDGGSFGVHQRPISTTSHNKQIVYLDGTNAQNSNFVLVLNGSSTSRSELKGHVYAHNTEAPIPYQGEVTCVSAVVSASGSPSASDCGDPNSNAGIAAWGSGICGPLAGGSN
jgi:hypothetical protein